MKYIILADLDGRELLEKEVELRLKEGWQLQGGVSISNYKTPSGLIKITFAQAMVKRNDE